MIPRTTLVMAACLLGGAFFPWWWPAVPGLVAGFWRPDKPFRDFLAAVLGGAGAWAVAALWFDVRNEGLLSGRVAPLFHLPGGGGLILATGLIGGLTAGLGALFGKRFRRFWASLQDALAAMEAPVPED
jgi:hypothetical protein